MSLRVRGSSSLRLAVRAAICSFAITCDNATIEPTIGPPATVLIVGGQDQTGIVGRELAQPIVAKIVDLQNRGVGGYAVTFEVMSGNGTVSPQQTMTSAEGVAAATWTLGSAITDSQHVELQVFDSVTRQKLASTVYRATSMPDAPVSLEKTAGDAQTSASGTAVAIEPAVKTVDQFGNPVIHQTVTWQASAGGTVGGASTATSATDETGTAVAPVAWVLSQTVGTNTLTATINGVPPVNFSASGTAGPPALLKFIVAPPSVATNGEPLTRQPVLQLADRYGNSVRLADAVVQITQIGGSGAGPLQIWNDTTRTNPEGIATFTGTTMNGRTGDGYRLGFSTPATTTLSSDPIELLRGQPMALALRIPADGASRGGNFTVQPVLQIVDAGGNSTPVWECVNASISFGGGLTGGTQISGPGETLSFNSLGISSTTSPGAYTITYTVGCCTPNQNIRPASQLIQIP